MSVGQTAQNWHISILQIELKPRMSNIAFDPNTIYWMLRIIKYYDQLGYYRLLECETLAVAAAFN